LYNQNPLTIPIAGSATYEAQFDLPIFSVIVDQKLSDNSTHVGTIGRWNGSAFPNPRLNPGDQITVTQGTSEVLQGDQIIYSGQKYNKWSKDDTVTNHRAFVIESGFPNTLTSQFNPTNNAIVQAQLLEGGIPGGSVEFKDPWYIDFQDAAYGNNWRNRGMTDALWYSKTSPFTPNTNPSGPGSEYKGVFLNQWYDVPNNPYYTVRAQQTQTISGFTYNFICWTGHPDSVVYQNANALETGVVFKQANAKATALYKGHFLSTNSRVTAAGGQRRIAEVVETEIVYESAGMIFYLSPYGSEVLLSTGTTNRNPSINSSWDGTFVVWESTSGNQRSIFFRRKVLQSWRETQTLATYAEDPAFEARPVVSLHIDPAQPWPDNDMMVVAYAHSTGFIQVLTALTNLWNLNPTWMQSCQYYGQKPSLSNQGTTITLTYQWGFDLQYALLQWANPTTRIWSDPFEIYESMDYEYLPGHSILDWRSYEPQVANAWDRTYICWQEYQEMDGVYPPFLWNVYTSRSFDNPYVPAGTVTAYGFGYDPEGELPSVPTISVLANASPVMHWSYEGWLYQSTGSDPLVVGEGNFPTACAQSDVSKFISKDFNYPLSGINYTRLSLAKASPMASTSKYSRVLTALDTVTHQSFSMSMTEPTIGGKVIPFTSVNDTLPGITAKNFLDFLTTQPVTISSDQDTVSFSFSISSKNFEEKTLPISVEAIGTNANEKIGSFLSIQHNLKEKGSSRSVQTMMKNLKGRAIQLKPTVPIDGLLGKNVVFRLTHVYMQEKDKLSLSKIQETNEIADNIPTEFGLSQNYPNPFNPSTVINYQLSALSHVTLKVYDMLGREVANLVEGMKEAGYYTATFNAAKLASGVYFARFVAQPEGGSQPFVQVKKLLMTK
jgi:hypothetical protein